MQNELNKCRMTAYASNTRIRPAPVQVGSSGWSAKIDCLLAGDYSFVGCKYSDHGVLFRGMSRGLCDCMNRRAFGRYRDNKPHAQLEQELDVFFLSHDLSDAISCSRIWETVNDAGILVMSAGVFNSAYEKREAAMMSFAEPGVVFKYPMLCHEIQFEKVLHLFVNRETVMCLQNSGIQPELLNNKLVCFDATGRASFEQAIQNFLDANQLQKSVPVTVPNYPGMVHA